MSKRKILNPPTAQSRVHQTTPQMQSSSLPNLNPSNTPKLTPTNNKPLHLKDTKTTLGFDKLDKDKKKKPIDELLELETTKSNK